MKLFFQALSAAILTLSLGSAALAQTQDTKPAAASCIALGGTASFDFRDALKGWTVAMTGDFRGGVFARVVGGPRDLGNGRTEYDLEHYFQREDGSTVTTRDKALFVAVPGEDRVLAGATYSVVATTGTLEGYTGQFVSWGSSNVKTGQGVLRFSGKLCK